MARVVVAMSGGVDSAVAASLLKEQGHDVIGLYMRTGAHSDDETRRAKTCCSAADSLDARAVADRLDIPFYALDFEREFARVMDDFADEYLAGRTPNPCVRCNLWLKFGKLWAYGKNVGADFVATGHHARVVAGPGGSMRIARAVDHAKDQSYVLFGLRADLLSKVRLPIGELTKSEVRAHALERGLPVHDKPDSQEICFIPSGDTAEFVRSRRPDRGETSGPILDESGVEVGRHPGFEAFTIGQRRGLGVAVGTPRYVVEIAPASRTVTIGPRDALGRVGLEASGFNWQVPEPDGPIACRAQIRAHHAPAPATATPVEGEPGRVVVRFDTPQTAVAPGQVVAVYDDVLLLGGGWIDRALTSP